MKLFRNLLDERQKLETMRVKSIGFVIVFFGLLVAIIVQGLFLGSKFTHVAGEFIVFLVGGIWATIGYIRCGIWDEFTKPGMKSYIFYSLSGGIIVGFAVSFAQYYRHSPYNMPLLYYLQIFAREFAITFALILIVSLLVGVVTKARQRKLLRKYEDDNG